MKEANVEKIVNKFKAKSHDIIEPIENSQER